MVRSQVLRRRLARAAASLRAGGLLSKLHGGGGLSGWRHERYVWLSEDTQQLCWAPLPERTNTDVELVKALAEKGHKCVSMSCIVAVSSGSKTPALKRAERRVAGSIERATLSGLSFKAGTALSFKQGAHAIKSGANYIETAAAYDF